MIALPQSLHIPPTKGGDHMAILELQDLEVEFGPEEGGGPHSGASKGCNISGLSLLLC